MSCDVRWWDQLDWWEHPATAYARGVEDGRQFALEEADGRLVAALTEALGGPDLKTGVQALIRHREQKATRDAVYAEALAGGAA